MLDAKGRKLSSRWCAEFAGFCWGEAYIGVTIYKRFSKTRNKKLIFYRGQIKIALRSDDLPLLRDFQDKLGGHLFKAGIRMVKGEGEKAYLQHQNYQWILVSRKDLRRAVSILEKSLLPAKKKKSLDAIKKYLEIVHDTGHKYTLQERGYLEEIRQLSIASTKFDGSIK